MSAIRLINGGDVRKYRKAIGLTQKELAEKAGVSQSLIARIENSTVDPRLSTIRKILKAITSVKAEKKIRDIMHSPVITINITDSVRRAIELMSGYNISQMPVLSNGRIVGSLQETTIINRMIRSRNLQSFFSDSIYNIMEKPFHTISPSADIDSILEVLSSGNSAVLVIDQKKLVGIVTKIDILLSTIRLDNFTEKAV